MDYLRSPIAVVKTTRRVVHVRKEVGALSKIGAADEHIQPILVRALGVLLLSIPCFVGANENKRLLGV